MVNHGIVKDDMNNDLGNHIDNDKIIYQMAIPEHLGGLPLNFMMKLLAGSFLLLLVQKEKELNYYLIA